jgi:uncharacterized membrane protein YkoI
MRTVSRHSIRIRRCRRSAVSACALAGLALAAGAALAQRDNDADAVLELQAPDREPRARAVQEQGPISLEDAVELVRMEFEGRVVNAETETVNGRRVHVIRIFDDVTVRDVHVDAATGRIRRR